MKLDLSRAGLLRLAVAVISVAMAAYHIDVIWRGAPEAILFRGMHLAFVLTLVFLLYRRTEAKTDGPTSDEMKAIDTRLPSLADWALLALGLTSIFYLFVNYDYVVNRIYYVDDLTNMDMALAVVLTLIVLEATRRVIGWALPLTALVFLAYGLMVAKMEPMRLLDQLYMTTEGIFGIPLSVSASYVLIFVLFGSFMERTGTGQLFMDFAMSLTGSSAGGPGKVSVMSSSLFGTISGSAVANVMVDGPISIPLMKRSGFTPAFAAGVESVASTGGQIMPPIMGAAAFVMAEFLAVSYGQVVLWALLPALLYYVACFAAVHFEAKRLGLMGLPRAELPRLGMVLRERGHLFIPVLGILTVMYSGYSAPLAALTGTMLCFPVAALRKSTRQYVNWRNVLDAFVDGARNALGVAAACACAGIVIGVVTLSGAGIVFTQFVVGLAQDTLLIALILTMIAGIVLGMGMPTTPAYIIMTSLLVPAIIKLGVIPPAAHMFAFYFAILSAITPPVALAVFAAAGLAKADLWSSGWAAVRIGATGFLIPFVFVYEPALLMIGSWMDILHVTVTATAGCTLLAAGLHGYLIGPASLWQRVALAIAAFLLVKPGIWTDIAGAALAVAIVTIQLHEKRRISSAAPVGR
ncbi:MAG TPA: TRAP transporter permease [Rhabdaerophilum sp.]|nr:TRAP transporter permease [Rhabdaerophilum sp.]